MSSKNTVSLLLLSILFVCCSNKTYPKKSSYPQPSQAEDKMPFHPAMVTIVFADGKTTYANLVSENSTQIKVRMVPGSEEYSINKQGVIISSNGNFPVGTRIKSITIKAAGKSIYDKVDQPNFNYGVLGFRFPDGKVQYASSLTVQPVFLSITMLHSGFNYQLYFKNGIWKIEMQGGEYSNGTPVRDVFELTQGIKKWY